MLAPPTHPVVALYGQDWKSLPTWHKRRQISRDEPDAVEIEVWSYKPTLFSEPVAVDRLSLYLSLKDTEDERVQAALDEMSRSLGW